MRNLITQAYFFLSFFFGHGQTVELKEMTRLPKELEEVSGMALIAPNRLLMINDSGNDAEFIVTDTLGNLIKVYPIAEVKNIDWEELAYDIEGHKLYVGDFGNNANKRKDLAIYKFDITGLLSEGTYHYEGAISYTYAEQNTFPPEGHELNFDMEAMVFAYDSLYLFSKNRTRPFDGYTYCYALPTKPGSYTATRKGKYRTGTGLKESYWVAGAALNANKTVLALTGYDKVWVFSAFTGSNWFSGISQQFYYNHLSQKEALVFDGDKLSLTDEQWAENGRKLYQVNLNDVKELVPIEELPYSVSVNQKSFADSLNIEIHTEVFAKVYWETFTTEGVREAYGKLGSLKPGTHKFVLDLSETSHGGHVLNVIVNDRPNAFRLTKPLILDTEK